MESPVIVEEESSKSQETENNQEDGDTLEKFTTAAFAVLAEATKKSNKLPRGRARDLYDSYGSFRTLIEDQANSVLSVLSAAARSINVRGNFRGKDDDDKLETIIDANDTILEKVGISLDDLSGVRRNPEPKFISQATGPFSGSWNRNGKVPSKAASKSLNEILNKTKNIEKPQLNFDDKVNNNSKDPFEPKIKYKFNMLKPLALIEEIDDDGISHFSHPYHFELHKFKPPKELLQSKPPIMFRPLEETPLHLVTTPSQVDAMIEDLEKQKEISIDLEHHSYRSFQGFTCLMQISTRESDYIVDTLSLRSNLQNLNKVFTNPSILKVFHGAGLDITWLQKDFSLYIVNMFDTHQAAKLLGFPKLSLAYLLSYYCNVEAQKHFQLADWRIRPLPEELITYAREDTHYLLYIYDNLRNALIEKANGQTNLLESVISESTTLCLKRYSKPVFEKDGYLDIYHRSKKLFDNRQKCALQLLYEWRDKIARETDESYAYVLPNHMMLHVSEILPREAQGILACCNPVPVPVRQHLLALHQIVLKAREQPLIKPVLEEQRLHRYTTEVTSLDNPLQCPHDLNHDGEFRDDLPVLFVQNGQPKSGAQTHVDKLDYCAKPIINVFEVPSKNLRSVRNVQKPLVPSPYNRYKLAKEFSESTEAKTHNNSNQAKEAEKQPSPINVTVKQEPIDILEDDNTSAQVDGTSETAPASESFDELGLKELVKLERKEKFAMSRKRKISEKETEDNAEKIKKKRKNRKKEKCPVLKDEPVQSEETNETKVTEKKANAKVRGGKPKKEFQPFDYSAVDFEKYRSSDSSRKNKFKNKGKPKNKNKKKKKMIHISI